MHDILVSINQRLALISEGTPSGHTSAMHSSWRCLGIGLVQLWVGLYSWITRERKLAKLEGLVLGLIPVARFFLGIVLHCDPQPNLALFHIDEDFRSKGRP